MIGYRSSNPVQLLPEPRMRPSCPSLRAIHFSETLLNCSWFGKRAGRMKGRKETDDVDALEVLEIASPLDPQA